MKKRIIAILFGINFLTAQCGVKDEWNDSTRKAFLSSCNKPSEKTKGMDMDKLCNCALKKIETKYNKPSDLEKAGEDAITQITLECLPEAIIKK